VHFDKLSAPPDPFRTGGGVGRVRLPIEFVDGQGAAERCRGQREPEHDIPVVPHRSEFGKQGADGASNRGSSNAPRCETLTMRRIAMGLAKAEIGTSSRMRARRRTSSADGMPPWTRNARRIASKSASAVRGAPAKVDGCTGFSVAEVASTSFGHGQRWI
jgi:hypothetical protein